MLKDGWSLSTVDWGKVKEKKRINAKDLVADIARLMRERVSEGPVVSLQEMQKLQAVPPALLVIEDDEIMRRSLHRIFEADGYRVHSAKDAMELTQIIHEISVDLVIVDVGLPWINGFELVGLMKSHADLKSVPVVFISGHNDVDNMKKGFAVGADDYITKPFDVVQVRQTISALLELSR